MKNKSIIEVSYQSLYAAVRSGSTLHLTDVLRRVFVKCGAMAACDLSDKAHRIYYKKIDTRRSRSLTERLMQHKRNKPHITKDAVRTAILPFKSE